ncbi:MAG: hypothetical protein PHQ98_03105 [Candidatus ainarchaeum sp.]|nr:hypothetical protein [Candidatus ainarchaeum sp.]
MELKDFVGKPCTSKVSYEFMPKKRTDIDLAKAKIELKDICTIEIDSKYMLIINIDNKTISIFKNGKLMVRGEKDEIKARETAKKICDALKESATEKKGIFNF